MCKRNLWCFDQDYNEFIDKLENNLLFYNIESSLPLLLSTFFRYSFCCSVKFCNFLKQSWILFIRIISRFLKFLLLLGIEILSKILFCYLFLLKRNNNIDFLNNDLYQANLLKPLTSSRESLGFPLETIVFSVNSMYFDFSF